MGKLAEFEGLDLEKVKKKWFENGEQLTDEEISGLFGKIEAKDDRLKAIRKYTDVGLNKTKDEKLKTIRNLTE